MTENTKIRCANKAIIIRDNQLLVIHKADEDGSFYILPGGGQQRGETAEEGLIRECFEEINVKVKVGKLLFVRDYISENHGRIDDILVNLHQLELMFLCDIDEGVPRNGNEIDEGQLSVEWIPVHNIDEYRLYPSAIKPYLKDNTFIGHTIYLGDVN